MSQAKVDQYKKDKMNRKKNMQKDKAKRAFRRIAVGVVSLALVGWLGYSVYNDPNFPKGQRSVYDADCYYLVPSWVLECIYINDPKESYSYDEEQIENDSNSTERTTDKFVTLTINAQTGEVTNPMDTSKNGWGDADYKGFIPWDKVK